MLRQWLINPLSNKNRIVERVDVVEGFVNNSGSLNKIRNSLESTIDLQRVMGKVNQQKATPRDVMGLAITLNNILGWKEILNSLHSKSLSALADQFIDSDNVVKNVFCNLNHDLPSQLKQGNIIRSGVDKKLDQYRALLKRLKNWISQFEKKMRIELNISSLKVKYNKVFGYYIEIRKTNKQKVPDTFIKKQTLVNSDRFITLELKKYEEKILNANSYIFKIEEKIFNEVCFFLIQNIFIINQNAILINKMDVLVYFCYSCFRKQLCETSF